MGWPWQRQEKQTSEPVLEPLSDRQYQSLLFSLLEAVDLSEQVRARLGIGLAVKISEKQS